MLELEQQLRETARQLLEDGQVACVIGWGATSLAGRFRPIFIENAEEAGQLVFNEHCLPMLAKYALAESAASRIALATRGCEGRAINRLLADKQLRRENLYLIGLPCPGMRQEDGALAEKCRACAYPDPLVYDVLLGAGHQRREREQAPRFAGVEELEQLGVDARYDYWQRASGRCIRCYACTAACPACSCRSCFVERHAVGWQGKQHTPAQNGVFHLTRAFHMAGRCVECGECERVCPMNIPLMRLNRKLLQDEAELFGAAEYGLSPQEKPLLGSFDTQDPDEFL